MGAFHPSSNLYFFHVLIDDHDHSMREKPILDGSEAAACRASKLPKKDGSCSSIICTKETSNQKDF